MSQSQDLDGEWVRSDHRCGIDNCRSKRYRRADDGLLYCSYGHQSDAPHLITFDGEDYRDPSQRIRKAEKERLPAPLRTSANLAGAEAVEEYLRCYQLVLFKQIQWLIDVRDIPAHFEEVVKDLWSLRLQMLDPLIRKAADVHDELRMHSSQTSSVASGDTSGSSATLVSALRLDDCLGLLYLSAMLTQLPVMIRDVLDWAHDDNFAFLRAEQYLPLQTYRRLPLAYRRTFHTRTGLLDTGELHSIVLHLAAQYMQSPNPLVWPSINSPPILFRIISEAAFPVEVFSATLKLGTCLEIKSNFSGMRTKYNRLADHPELQLIALLLVTVKLLYPFDDVARRPTVPSEPAALALDWADWAKAFADHPIIGKKDQETNQEDTDQPPDDWNTHEHDVLDMNGDRIDEYLDWFQQTWIGEDTAGQARDQDFERDLRSLFPLPPVNEKTTPRNDVTRDSAAVARIKRVQADLTYRPPARHRHHDSKDTHSRPGNRYRHYRSVDDIPSTARPIFDLLAHLGAVSVEMLVSAVFRIERRLRRWDDLEAKKAAEG